MSLRKISLTPGCACVLVPLMSATTANTLADRFAWMIEWLCKAMAAEAHKRRVEGPLAIALWNRLRRYGRAVRRALCELAGGKAARSAGAAAARGAGTACRFASAGRAVAVQLVPQAAAGDGDGAGGYVDRADAAAGDDCPGGGGAAGGPHPAPDVLDGRDRAGRVFAAAAATTPARALGGGAPLTPALPLKGGGRTVPARWRGGSHASTHVLGGATRARQPRGAPPPDYRARRRCDWISGGVVSGLVRPFRYDLATTGPPRRLACVAMPAPRRKAASPADFWRPSATIHNELKLADPLRP